MNKFYKATEKKMSKIDGRKHRKMIFTTEWSIIKKKYGVYPRLSIGYLTALVLSKIMISVLEYIRHITLP